MRLLIVLLILFGALSPSLAQQTTGQSTNKSPARSKAEPRIAAFNESLAKLRVLFKQRKFQRAIPLSERLVDQAREI